VNGEPTLEETASQIPTAREVATVLYRQRVVVLISFLSVLIGVISYGILFPSYQAEMKFLVRKGRVDPPVAPQPTALEYSRYDVSEEEINSEVQLLQDWDVLRPVVISSGSRMLSIQPGGTSKMTLARGPRAQCAGWQRACKLYRSAKPA
jgi:uncharacterized protein involved in exopolysaccharide biosynthesis